MVRLRSAASLWWPVAAPPALWALQGACAGLLASLACAPGGAHPLSEAGARAGVAVATAIGLAGAAGALWVSLERLRAIAPVTHPALVEDTRASAAWAGAFVAAVFVLGLLYGALPAFVVGVCETMR